MNQLETGVAYADFLPRATPMYGETYQSRFVWTKSAAVANAVSRRYGVTMQRGTIATWTRVTSDSEALSDVHTLPWGYNAPRRVIELPAYAGGSFYGRCDDCNETNGYNTHGEWPEVCVACERMRHADMGEIAEATYSYEADEAQDCDSHDEYAEAKQELYEMYLNEY